MVGEKYCLNCDKWLEPIHTPDGTEDMDWCPHCFPKGKKTYDLIKVPDKPIEVKDEQ